MDLIGPRYLKGGFKFYFFSIMDVDTHYAGIYPIKNKSAKNIVPCLIDFWSDYQLPVYITQKVPHISIEKYTTYQQEWIASVHKK